MGMELIEIFGEEPEGLDPDCIRVSTHEAWSKVFFSKTIIGNELVLSI
jgi:hypothetical protein